VNVRNPAPTTAVNHIIALYNEQHHTMLAPITQEDLLAAILAKFESFYHKFQHCGHGFNPFLDIYYKRWLHT
jgi:biotin--protein ligase